MVKEQEFTNEFQRLKSKVGITALYSDVIGDCLTLLEKMKCHYKGSCIENAIYSEGKELCQKLLDNHPKFIDVGSYNKRFDILNGPYDERQIEHTNGHETQSYLLQENVLTLPKLEKSLEERTDDNVLNNDLENNGKSKKKKIKKKDLKYLYGPKLNFSEDDNFYGTVPQRKELLDILRREYEHKEGGVKKKDLKYIFGPRINTLDGLLDALEEIYASGINVFTDPVFIKMDEKYSDEIEEFEETKHRKKHQKDLAKYEELKEMHDSLMDKIDIVGCGIEYLRRLKYLENVTDVKESEESEEIEPSEKDLLDLEKMIKIRE